MHYKTVNFVVLRSAGIPQEYMDKFRFSDHCMQEIRDKQKPDDHALKTIKLECERFIDQILTVSDDFRVKDMIRISTPNYLSFYRQLLEKRSPLSQYHRKFMMYLQRGCFKCCTAGTYGPVAIGKFEHSSKSILIRPSAGKRFIMLEDWALRKILHATNIKLDEKRYLATLEDFTELRKFNIGNLTILVELLSRYACSETNEQREIIFSEITLTFEKITGTRNREFDQQDARSKDYESRAIFYELAKRPISFDIGSKLFSDIEKINTIFGIYLALMTQELIRGICENKSLDDDKSIQDYVFGNFHEVSESVIARIINEKITSFTQIDYKYDVLPPIFSPDITICSRDELAINNGNYELLLGEIHVSPTIISNPMFEFERSDLINQMVTAIKNITNSEIIFKPYKLEENKDFTHTLPLSVQKDIILLCNVTSDNTQRTYYYRSDSKISSKKDILNTLFFPLAIGRRILFNSAKDDKWGMWSRNYLPEVIRRISSNLYPELKNNIKLRHEQEIALPKIVLPKKITYSFIFELMKKINQWRDEHNLLDKIFVRYSSNRKPIYIDFNNPHLVYELIKLSSKKETVSISSLLPSLQGTWLEDEEGHYCNEFRYMVSPSQDNIIKPVNKKIKIIFLPGYSSRLDELHYLKERLISDGWGIDSILIDYNKKFDEVVKKVAEYIIKKDYSDLIVIGISMGGVLAIKLLEFISDRVIKVFSINPFCDRSELLKKNRPGACFEEIKVTNFSFDPSKLLVINGLQDTRVDSAHALKISEMSDKIKLISVESADHMFSDLDSQSRIADIIHSEMD